jgi:hypothetical protein
VLVASGVRAGSNIEWSFAATLSLFLCFSFRVFPCICSLSWLSVGRVCSSAGEVGNIVSLRGWASYNRWRPPELRRGSWSWGPARSRCSRPGLLHFVWEVWCDLAVVSCVFGVGWLSFDDVRASRFNCLSWAGIVSRSGEVEVW